MPLDDCMKSTIDSAFICSNSNWSLGKLYLLDVVPPSLIPFRPLLLNKTNLTTDYIHLQLKSEFLLFEPLSLDLMSLHLCQHRSPNCGLTTFWTSFAGKFVMVSRFNLYFPRKLLQATQVCRISNINRVNSCITTSISYIG